MTKKFFVILFSFMLCVKFVYAGGFFIHEESIRFNGRPCGSTIYLRQNREIGMSFIADGYSFSGGKDKYEYYLFKFTERNSKKIFYVFKLVRRYGYTTSEKIFHNINIKLLPSGDFTLSYYHEPLFFEYSKFREGEVYSIEEILSELPQKSYRDIENDYIPLDCKLKILDREDPDGNFSLYLKLNDKIPGYFKIDSNCQKVHFSFIVKNVTNEKNIIYRFRLFPDENWSEWTTESDVDYYFISRGSHEFEVECRYEKNSYLDSTNSARYSFVLESPFISSPQDSVNFGNNEGITFIDKGDIRRKARNSDSIGSQVYDRSRALVIGVGRFSDKTFSPLPYIDNDVQAISNTLQNMHFDVKKSKKKSRSGIIEDIRNELNDLHGSDRLIIYISSHGFVDPISGKPLIATSDCEKNNPGNAIYIEELKELIKGSSKNCRHILLILDCCASGLSIIEKNNSLGAMRSLATQCGTSIFTAGMSDQNAEMDENIKMSLFTYYLVDGLSQKKADYTKDGIVTLTELLIYVQYNVAKRTDSKQVPMSGRISGNGEMIFY